MRKSATTTVTIASPAAAHARRLLAQNLSVLLARGRRKVLLLDTDHAQDCLRWGQERPLAGLRPSLTACKARRDDLINEFERVRSCYDDIVVDTEETDTQASRCSLIAAQLALVAVAPFDCLASLADRLNCARMFNPALRVCCVAVTGETGPAPEELERVRAFAAWTATQVTDTVLHLPALAWGAGVPGQCACDLESSAGAAGMAALHHEIYPTPSSQSRTRGWRMFSA